MLVKEDGEMDDRQVEQQRPTVSGTSLTSR